MKDFIKWEQDLKVFEIEKLLPTCYIFIGTYCQIIGIDITYTQLGLVFISLPIQPLLAFPATR